MSRLTEILQRVHNYQVAIYRMDGEKFTQANFRKAKDIWRELIYPSGADDLIYLATIAAQCARFIQSQPFDKNNMCLHCTGFVTHLENCPWEQLRESLK